MEPFVKYGFIGCISADEIHKLIPKVRGKTQVRFIINTLPSKAPEKEVGHWQAVYIDTEHAKELCFYDSFADEPTPQIMRDIKGLIDAMGPETYLKFKINKGIDQWSNSFECGWYAMHFLVQMFEGKKFKDCTRYSDVRRAEKEIKKFEQEFPYI